MAILESSPLSPSSPSRPLAQTHLCHRSAIFLGRNSGKAPFFSPLQLSSSLSRPNSLSFSLSLFTISMAVHELNSLVITSMHAPKNYASEGIECGVGCSPAVKIPLTAAVDCGRATAKRRLRPPHHYF